MPYDRTFAPKDKESLTVSSTAVQLTAATKAGKAKAKIYVETSPIRYWLDGSTPTATVGHKAAAGSEIILDEQEEVLNFYVVLDTAAGADATLRVTYYT